VRSGGLAHLERRIEELRCRLSSSSKGLGIAREALGIVVRQGDALAGALRRGDSPNRELVKDLGDAARVVRETAERLERMLLAEGPVSEKDRSRRH
jgi:hypothetical protein